MEGGSKKPEVRTWDNTHYQGGRSRREGMEKPVEKPERGNQEEGSVRWRHQEKKRSQKRNDEDWGIRESSGWS